MKKYILFLGQQYYPSKGLGDMVGDYDTLREAIKALFVELERSYSEYHKYIYDDFEEFLEHEAGQSYACIYDTEDRKNVLELNNDTDFLDLHKTHNK